MMKLTIFTRSGMIPSARAARVLPPTANIQLPNRDLSSMIQNTTTSAAYQIMETRMIPRSPTRTWRYGIAESTHGKGQPLEIRSTIPLQIIIEPSVVMNEGMLSFVVTIPFRAPMPMQARSGRMKAIRGFHPELSISPFRTGANAKTDPTERSNSPEIIRRVTPIVRIPSSGSIWRITLRLSRLMNSEERI